MIAINETLKVLPPAVRQEVFDFVEFLAQKYLKKQSKAHHNQKEILKFAGSWKDMKEEDFQSFVNEVYERRERSFKSRRGI